MDAEISIDPSSALREYDIEACDSHNIGECDDFYKINDTQQNYNEVTDSGDEHENKDNATAREQPCCAICLEPFQIGIEISYSMDVAQCQHEYHTTCITEWLMKHVECPYCRRMYIPLPSSDRTDEIVTITSDATVDVPTLTTTTATSVTISETPEPIVTPLPQHRPHVIQLFSTRQLSSPSSQPLEQNFPMVLDLEVGISTSNST
jgi:Ring finger domain